MRYLILHYGTKGCELDGSLVPALEGPIPTHAEAIRRAGELAAELNQPGPAEEIEPEGDTRRAIWSVMCGDTTGFVMVYAIDW